MLETPHVAIGAAIATAIPNPLISIPLAFTSHFLLDMAPHWNPHLNTETKKFGHLTNKTYLIIGIDLVSAIVLTGLLFRGNMNVLYCSFASVLPDLVEAPYYILGYKNKYLEVWRKFQKSIQTDANVFWGLLTQVVTLAAVFYWMFK
jgi:hypothetical protein